MRQDTIKLLEENIGKTFSDINLTNVFLGQSPKETEIKAKYTNGPNQTDELLHSKGNHKKNKKQNPKWEYRMYSKNPKIQNRRK